MYRIIFIAVAVVALFTSASMASGGELYDVLDSLKLNYAKEPDKARAVQYVYVDSTGEPFKESTGDVRHPLFDPESFLHIISYVKGEDVFRGAWKEAEVARVLSVVMFGKQDMRDSVLIALRSAISDAGEAMNLHTVFIDTFNYLADPPERPISNISESPKQNMLWAKRNDHGAQLQLVKIK